MASFILTSYIHSREKDELGNRYPVVIHNANGILDEIRQRLTGYKRVVFVANDPEDTVENDEKGKMFFRSLEMSDMKFEEGVILDSRSKTASRDILLHSELIILSGGKILKQNAFFREIGMREILAECEGVIVGISAGTMNLCETVFNFPEEVADINDIKWIEGLGFYDKIIVPHFDCRRHRYLLECEDFDITNDYILPFSKTKDLLGLGNDSFVVIDGDKKKIVGDYVVIHNGKIIDDNN